MITGLSSAGAAQLAARVPTEQIRHWARDTAALAMSAAAAAKRSSHPHAVWTQLPMSRVPCFSRAASFASAPLLPTRQHQLEQAQEVHELVLLDAAEHAAHSPDSDFDKAGYLAAASDIREWPHGIALPEDTGARFGMMVRAAILSFSSVSVFRYIQVCIPLSISRCQKTLALASA